MTFAVPAGFMIKTNDLDAPGNITFETLTDPALDARRSILSGTVIASGNVVVTSPDGLQACQSFTPTSVFVELAENGLIGLLASGGNPIDFSELAGAEGILVSVGGYFDVSLGTLFATVVETEIVKSQPGTDAVAITRAEGRLGSGGELRVEGANTRTLAGTFVASVTVYSGGLDVTGTNCAGTALGNAPVSTVDGTWSLRRRPISPVPTEVCAKSAGGGIAREVGRRRHRDPRGERPLI